ncbi:UreD urease accessory protein-domain-containing protein [Mortierella sp. GBAus27b]|nr:UreD urease accessory protein-domain-containing protein [Mortierella sp. GBAus27b]
MVFQPASAHFPTRVVATGAFTTAVVSQNFLRATAQSKTSLTQIDSLRASYPIKLISPVAANTTFLPSATSSSSNPESQDDDKNGSNVSGTEKAASGKLPLPPPPRIVYVITYGGGLLADDHPDLQFVLQRHSRLLVLGQGNTKIFKSPTIDHPPASQTLHSTVGPGALFLFLGPAVVACEDSSVFLRHEVVLQAQRPSARVTEQAASDEDDELPSCVVLDWITGGRGEEERWKARRSEWRLIVRWSELEPEGTSTTSSATDDSSNSDAKRTEVEEEEEEEFVEEEDPREVADRLAGGPVVFRDGFLIEHNSPLPSTSRTPTATTTTTDTSTTSTVTTEAPVPQPKMTSYAPSLYPHSTIGSLFIMGPKTRRLQRSILNRYEHMTVYPGQKPEQRADYPILWSVTVVQVPRPPEPNQRPPSASSKSIPRRKHQKMNAMVVKMASQGVEQMQNFMTSLFEEQAADMDNRKKMMDSDDEEEDEEKVGKGDTSDKDHRKDNKEGLTVVEELFGGRTVWERVFQ